MPRSCTTSKGSRMVITFCESVFCPGTPQNRVDSVSIVLSLARRGLGRLHPRHHSNHLLPPLQWPPLLFRWEVPQRSKHALSSRPPPNILTFDNRKVPVGVIVGCTVAGVAVFSIAVALLLWLKRRGRLPQTDSETEEIKTPQHMYTSFDQSQATEPINSPPFDTTPVIVSFDSPPLDRFWPEIQDDARGNGHLMYQAMMDVSLPTITTSVQPPMSAPFPVLTITHDAPPAMPVSRPPPALLHESRAPSTTETTDADALSITSSISPSVSSVSPLFSQFDRRVREEVQTVAGLIMQVSPADATRILEALQRGGDGGTSTGGITVPTAATERR